MVRKRTTLITTAFTPRSSRKKPGVKIIEFEGNGGAIFSH